MIEIVKLKCKFILEGDTSYTEDIIEIESNKVPFGVEKVIETEYGCKIRSLSFYYID